MRVRGLPLLFAFAALAQVPGAAPAPSQAVKLVGTVGPGFSITLEFPDGRPATQLDPGTYEITVRDLSDEHNFHLYGPGVEQSTQVETTGTVTWTVTFREARYTVVCDPHANQMVRLITVGNPPAPSRRSQRRRRRPGCSRRSGRNPRSRFAAPRAQRSRPSRPVRTRSSSATARRRTTSISSGPA